SSYGQCQSGVQLTTTRHVPVYLASKRDPDVFGRFDGVKGALVPLAGAGAKATGATACGGRYALLYRPAVPYGQEGFALYDSDTGKVDLLPGGGATQCPRVGFAG